jgi:hypothetical protein
MIDVSSSPHQEPQEQNSILDKSKQYTVRGPLLSMHFTSTLFKIFEASSKLELLNEPLSAPSVYELFQELIVRCRAAGVDQSDDVIKSLRYLFFFTLNDILSPREIEIVKVHLINHNEFMANEFAPIYFLRFIVLVITETTFTLPPHRAVTDNLSEFLSEPQLPPPEIEDGPLEFGPADSKEEAVFASLQQVVEIAVNMLEEENCNIFNCGKK